MARARAALNLLRILPLLLALLFLVSATRAQTAADVSGRGSQRQLVGRYLSGMPLMLRLVQTHLIEPWSVTAEKPN